MVLAGLFAGILFLGFILGDWLYFVRLTPDAVRYGCNVARTRDRWASTTLPSLRDRFNTDGALMLPHGVARFYPELSQIAIRPKYRLFAIGFRTAWPVKGLIHLSTDGQAIGALCIKRIPWSSALITLLWFAVVLIGLVMFVVAYARDGGFASLQGLILGFGLVAGALAVMAIGVVTVIISYRLENSRLTKVYEELREAVLNEADPSTQPPPQDATSDTPEGSTPHDG